MSKALFGAFVLNNTQSEISSLTALAKELQALRLAEELRDVPNDTQALAKFDKQTTRKGKI